MLGADHNKIIPLFTPFPSIPIFGSKLLIYCYFCSKFELGIVLFCIVLYVIDMGPSIYNFLTLIQSIRRKFQNMEHIYCLDNLVLLTSVYNLLRRI